MTGQLILKRMMIYQGIICPCAGYCLNFGSRRAVVKPACLDERKGENNEKLNYETVIFFGCAASDLGSVMVKIPSSCFASMPSPSTSLGKRNLRAKLPYRLS